MKHMNKITLLLILLPALIVLVVTAMMWNGSAGLAGEITGWVNGIENPTEKGCAYIAIAIIAHGIATLIARH